MLSDYASSWKNQMRASKAANEREITRRTAHGGSAWGARPEVAMRQPQDGGLDLDGRSRIAEISAHLTRTNLIEPEDARLTGSTRSLMRRLMGLNVIGRMAQKAAVAPRLLLTPRKEVQVA
jgi:hypothetical protein